MPGVNCLTLGGGAEKQPWRKVDLVHYHQCEVGDR